MDHALRLPSAKLSIDISVVHCNSICLQPCTGVRYVPLDEVVQRILALANANTKIIPGHGPLSDRAGLRAYRDMLKTIRDRVKQSIVAGQPLDTIVAAKPTADFDEVWGKGFLKPYRFLSIVYEDLSRR